MEKQTENNAAVIETGGKQTVESSIQRHSVDWEFYSEYDEVESLVCTLQ